MRIRGALVALAAVLMTACSGNEKSVDDRAGAAEGPSEGIWATLDSQGDTFRVLLTTQAPLSQVLQWSATGAQPTGLTGRVAAGGLFNPRYSWNLTPESVEFRDTPDLPPACKVKPSALETGNAWQNCAEYSPPQPRIVSALDCRTGACTPLPPPTGGTPAYDPCQGKACGDRCTVCPPDDPTCFETAVIKECTTSGQCAPAPASCP